MSRKQHNLDEVIRSLSKKKDVKIDVTGKVVFVLKRESVHAVKDLGNKSWGKIDFLCNYQGYKLNRVVELPKINNY